FTAEVISELKIIWPKLVLAHGKPRHPQSQGSMERANGDIKDMLVAWMGDKNTTDWSIGIKFVQFQKNSSLHAGIHRSPSTAMFGCEAKVGLTSSSLPDEVIQRMQCEDDLLAVLTTGQNGEEPGPVPSAESAEVHFDTERPSPPSVAPNTRYLFNLYQPRFMLMRSMAIIPNLDIDTERGCHQSIVSSTQRETNPAVSRAPANHLIMLLSLFHILGVILERDQNDMYTIGVKAGVLKAKLSCNQFDLCPQRLLGEESISLCEKPLPLNRTVVDRVLSITTAQDPKSVEQTDGYITENYVNSIYMSSSYAQMKDNLYGAHLRRVNHVSVSVHNFSVWQGTGFLCLQP
ncbi:uncharacterized protein LOC119569649, partial [Penaeus monodon]|uniref:uncharacterized protein LOC119569649 n=1 Tax=Penaeus monodon TaxID=6687 RepID=UPI0018A741D3